MRSHTNAKMQSSAESNIKLTFLISGHKRFVGRSPTMPWWIEHLDETRSASIVTQTAHNQRTTMRQMLAADSLDGLCIQTSIYSSFTQRLRMNIIRSARHSKKLQAFLVAAVAGVTVAACCYYCLNENCEGFLSCTLASHTIDWATFPRPTFAICRCARLVSPPLPFSHSTTGRSLSQSHSEQQRQQQQQHNI